MKRTTVYTVGERCIKKMKTFYMTQEDKDIWIHSRMVENRSYLADWPLVLGLVMQRIFEAHTICLKDKPRYIATSCEHFVPYEYWTGIIPKSMGLREPPITHYIILEYDDLKYNNRRYFELESIWPLRPQILEELGTWLCSERGKLPHGSGI